MPSRPPSPCGTTPGTVITGDTVWSGAILTILAADRSVTSALPSGRNAIDQGTSSPVAIADTDPAFPVGAAPPRWLVDADEPDVQAPSITSSAAAIAAGTLLRGLVTLRR